jgi:hypothetical protein
MMVEQLNEPMQVSHRHAMATQKQNEIDAFELHVLVVLQLRVKCEQLGCMKKSINQSINQNHNK